MTTFQRKHDTHVFRVTNLAIVVVASLRLVHLTVPAFFRWIATDAAVIFALSVRITVEHVSSPIPTSSHICRPSFIAHSIYAHFSRMARMAAHKAIFTIAIIMTATLALLQLQAMCRVVTLTLVAVAGTAARGHCPG